METLTNNTENDFHWKPLNLSLSILMGVVSTLAIWFFAGLLLMLFM
jgi:hypothetical protein